MTDQEVNVIIAEFEDDTDFTDVERFVIKGKTVRCILECGAYFTIKNYCNDLNALVPVWDKCRYTPQLKRRTGKKGWVCSGKQSYLEDVYGYGDTIQQAAAHATAKAIVEFNNA